MRLDGVVNLAFWCETRRALADWRVSFFSVMYQNTRQLIGSVGVANKSFILGILSNLSASVASSGTSNTLTLSHFCACTSIRLPAVYIQYIYSDMYRGTSSRFDHVHPQPPPSLWKRTMCWV